KSVVPNTYHYHISKLFEHSHKNCPIVEANFKTIKETICEIKIEVEKRYIKISALPGMEDTLNQLEYIINRLDMTLIRDKIEDENELRIFIQALKNNSEDLFKMIEEID